MLPLPALSPGIVTPDLGDGYGVQRQATRMGLAPAHDGRQ